MFYCAYCASIVKLRFPSMTKMLQRVFEHTKGHSAHICTPAEKQNLDIYLCCVCFMFHITCFLQSPNPLYTFGICARLKDNLGGHKLWGMLLADLITLSVHVETQCVYILRMWIAFRFACVRSNQDKMVCVPKFWDCRN